MSEFESALTSLEAKVAEAQKSADRLVKLLRRISQAARTGALNDLERGLAQAGSLGTEANAAAQALGPAWTFDARSHMSRDYLADLIEAATEAGVNLIEKDGRLYAFPLVVRIAADQAAVRVGKKLERRIRPKVLAALLAAIQKRPQRLSEQKFLDLLYAVYQRVAGPEWRQAKSGSGPVVPLGDVHRLLTLLPGSDYPVEEFGRDLLLLDRKPDLRTRDGGRVAFPGAALAREKVERIVAYDEDGRERAYLGLRFEKEA